MDAEVYRSITVYVPLSIVEVVFPGNFQCRFLNVFSLREEASPGPQSHPIYNPVIFSLRTLRGASVQTSPHNPASTQEDNHPCNFRKSLRQRINNGGRHLPDITFKA
ncbi:hypothetical protein Trydic_g3291 [Trypoxylus dichotomus]